MNKLQEIENKIATGIFEREKLMAQQEVEKVLSNVKSVDFYIKKLKESYSKATVDNLKETYARHVDIVEYIAELIKERDLQ
jgi:hypothetical protein